MARYINTERLGVNKTEEIILNEFDWIFREQGIVDVGIDAVIEKVENGTPLGKFIAVQIKTGASNFKNITDDSLTLYVTHIHYNYWLHLNIPIILVAHLPKTNETYWQHIDINTLEKTPTSWKLIIPKTNIFGLQAKELINQKLCFENYVNPYSEINKFDPLYDSVLDINSLKEYINSLTRLKELSVEFTKTTINFKKELLQTTNCSLTKRKRHMRIVARSYYTFSRRAKKELEVFSEFFVEGVNYHEQILRYFIENGAGLDKKTILSLRQEQLIHEEGIRVCKLDKERYIDSLSKITDSITIEGFQALISFYDMQIREFTVAVALTKKLILNLEKLTG